MSNKNNNLLEINLKQDTVNHKHYYIETWGCQMNEEDSEKLSGMLKSLGYEKTLLKENADVIKKSGFDIKTEAKRLEEIYLELIGK